MSGPKEQSGVEEEVKTETQNRLEGMRRYRYLRRMPEVTWVGIILVKVLVFLIVGLR